MKASELRIGNYFHPCLLGNGVRMPATLVFHKVGAVDKFGSVTVIEPGEKFSPMYAPGDYVGVPLTPDILEKAGFEYYTWGKPLDFTHMIKSEIILRIHNEGCSVFNLSPCNSDDKQFVCQVKYLHQLQNIWFCIKNEELTINL